MTSQLSIYNNKTSNKTLPLSNTPAQKMFESSPFVVQSKNDNSQQPDLKASLIQAEKYGHHLSKNNLANQSVSIAVQAKKVRESGNAEVIQMRPMRRQPRASSGRTNPYPQQRPLPYRPGQHGYRQQEQQRLTQEHGVRISGNTHQSEHPIGFEPLNQTSGLRRGSPGRASQLENRAPAYQEVHNLHRNHPGTGTGLTTDASGFNSRTYRDAQRRLLENGDVSSAVQLNQLAYAFNPNSRRMANTPQGLAATNSYNTMVNNMHQVQYAQGANNVTVPVNRLQQQEMLLGRRAQQTGQWPTTFQVNRARMESQSDILLRGQQQRQQQQSSAMDLS